jgi:hypothetical protein
MYNKTGRQLKSVSACCWLTQVQGSTPEAASGVEHMQCDRKVKPLTSHNVLSHQWPSMFDDGVVKGCEEITTNCEERDPPALKHWFACQRRNGPDNKVKDGLACLDALHFKL